MLIQPLTLFTVHSGNSSIHRNIYNGSRQKNEAIHSCLVLPAKEWNEIITRRSRARETPKGVCKSNRSVCSFLNSSSSARGLIRQFTDTCFCSRLRLRLGLSARLLSGGGNKSISSAIIVVQQEFLDLNHTRTQEQTLRVHRHQTNVAHCTNAGAATAPPCEEIKSSHTT